MRFVETGLPACTVVEVEAHEDERGFFARTWCAREFEEAGLPTELVQASVSRNLARGTLRGLHFQLPPSREGKLVRCTRGAVVDVALDLRASSPSFLKHVKVELTAENCRAIFIPPGCAHGFQTLDDGSDVSYQMTDFYAPDLGSGLRWNDPAFAIEWPLADPTMNDRDRSYPDVDQEWLRSLSWS